MSLSVTSSTLVGSRWLREGHPAASKHSIFDCVQQRKKKLANDTRMDGLVRLPTDKFANFQLDRIEFQSLRRAAVLLSGRPLSMI